MPGKKGKKKGGKKGKGKKKGKSSASPVKKDGQIPDVLPKPDYVPPVRQPGETLVELLTTHHVQEKELHNFKVSIKPLEELTPQEVRDLRFVFNTFDTNEDGLINAGEFRNAMKVIGFKLTPQEAKMMCSESGMMRNAPPSITLNDFLGYVVERQGDASDYQSEILKGFKLMDLEGTGQLSIDTLRQTAEDIGIQITEEDLREMVAEADLNGDGFIDRDEFIQIMQQTNLF